MNIGARVAAGMTTGALAVLIAQPTDVVKVRFQATITGASSVRYSSTIQAYKAIATNEGINGLWKGTKILTIRRHFLYSFIYRNIP